MKPTYRVNGMTCGGCAQALRRAIAQAAPSAKIEVDLEAGTAQVEGLDAEAVERAVQQAGFEFAGQVRS